jgi:hypothetical protein
MDQAYRVSFVSTPAAVLMASRMRTYVPHRQALPVMAVSIWAWL